MFLLLSLIPILGLNLLYLYMQQFAKTYSEGWHQALTIAVLAVLLFCTVDSGSSSPASKTETYSGQVVSWFTQPAFEASSPSIASLAEGDKFRNRSPKPHPISFASLYFLATEIDKLEKFDRSLTFADGTATYKIQGPLRTSQIFTKKLPVGARNMLFLLESVVMLN